MLPLAVLEEPARPSEGPLAARLGRTRFGRGTSPGGRRDGCPRRGEGGAGACDTIPGGGRSRLEHRYTTSEARRADIETAQLAAGGPRPLRQFSPTYTLDPPAATSDLPGPPISPRTHHHQHPHQAKGCAVGLVPSPHVADGTSRQESPPAKRGVEEERPTALRGMTRARNHLYALPAPSAGGPPPAVRAGGPQWLREVEPVLHAGLARCLEDHLGRSRRRPGDGTRRCATVPDHHGDCSADRAIASLGD